jgi:hypothetical protein
MDRPEDAVSVTLVLVVYLLGWVRAYSEASGIHVKDVQEGSYAFSQLLDLTFKLLLPYFEVWVVLLCGLIILYIVDKIFVTIVSLTSQGGITMGDSYATGIFLGALQQMPILSAMLVSMAATMVLVMAWMYYVRVQKKPSDALLNRGMNAMQIFGLVLAFSMMIIQGYFMGV